MPCLIDYSMHQMSQLLCSNKQQGGEWEGIKILTRQMLQLTLGRARQLA